CFAVTVRGYDTAIGIFQVRDLGHGFDTAEWGFALGSPFWGTGVFQDGAKLILEFVFETMGVRRLEARAAVLNGRGNGALQKIGAVQEGLLRKSLLRDGRYLDQALYAIVDAAWRVLRQHPSDGAADDRVAKARRPVAFVDAEERRAAHESQDLRHVEQDPRQRRTAGVEHDRAERLVPRANGRRRRGDDGQHDRRARFALVHEDAAGRPDGGRLGDRRRADGGGQDRGLRKGERDAEQQDGE